jgi:hypothetical protein
LLTDAAFAFDGGHSRTAVGDAVAAILQPLRARLLVAAALGLFTAVVAAFDRLLARTTLDQVAAVVVAQSGSLLRRSAFGQFAIRALAFGGFTDRACPGQVALAVAAILGLAGLATRGVRALLALAHVACRLATTAFGDTRGIAALCRLPRLLGVAACPDLAIASLLGALTCLLADLGLAACLLRLPLTGLALPGLHLAGRSLPLLGGTLGLALLVTALAFALLVLALPALALLLGTCLFGLAARLGTRVCAIVLLAPVVALVAIAATVLRTGRRLQVQAQGEQRGQENAHRAL